MSTTPDVPRLPGNELKSDDDAAFDDLARRAGAALRRPAPEDGVRLIAHRGRRQRALKATVVGAVVAASLIGVLVVVSSHDDADRVTSVDSTPAPTPTVSGDEISVTPDFIQFGDGLVGNGWVAKADGRTYVAAGHFDDAANPLNDPQQDLWWFRPKTAVLAAFDDAGVELWRTELDEPPAQVVAVAGDVWLLANGASHVDGVGTLSRIDASNGRVVDQKDIVEPVSMVGAFGKVWVLTGSPEQNVTGYPIGRPKLIRVDPDRSTTTIDLPERIFSADDIPAAAEFVTAGPDTVWVPLGQGGVAVINPDTSEVTTIPVADIGHDVERVAFDGDVTYVASRNRVTSIVDGEVHATHSTGGISFLGRVDGVFGALIPGGQFVVLRADDPMKVDVRQIAIDGATGSTHPIDGEPWMETGRNFNLRRVELLPTGDG